MPSMYPGFIQEKTCKFQSLLILCILKDFPIHIDTISMGLSIVYFKGSQVKFSKL